MGFPVFFIMILCIVILLTITVIAYLQVYKRHINEVIQGKSAVHARMLPPYKVAIGLTIIVLIVGLVVSYFVGYKTAYDNFEDAMSRTSLDIYSFYAEVKDVGENTLSVEGIALNEENYRGEFKYEVWGETRIEWHDELISLNDLSEGDLVSITLATAGGGITDVYQIRLLEDEK